MADGERRVTRPSRKIQPKKVVQAVSTLDDFNNVVLNERDRIVVVRFHATYCKACEAIRVAYDRLAKRNPDVKFVDVSISDKNNLSEKLGIPGVPFGQIYVPGAGLVEGLPMSRRHMAKFKKTLNWYVKGRCDVPEEFFENPHQMYENENLIL
jgi:thioredoxin 1